MFVQVARGFNVDRAYFKVKYKWEGKIVPKQSPSSFNYKRPKDGTTKRKRKKKKETQICFFCYDCFRQFYKSCIP